MPMATAQYSGKRGFKFPMLCAQFCACLYFFFNHTALTVTVQGDAECSSERSPLNWMWKEWCEHYFKQLCHIHTHFKLKGTFKVQYHQQNLAMKCNLFPVVSCFMYLCFRHIEIRVIMTVPGGYVIMVIRHLKGFVVLPQVQWPLGCSQSNQDVQWSLFVKTVAQREATQWWHTSKT